jgi:dTDP-4-amino-4,6-dideoxygalactose transaminase
MTTTTKARKENAKFGAKAFAPGSDKLPGVFPREMGPNAMKYLQEVVDKGLASDMVERFEAYLAKMHGMKFCIGTPGCTQAIFATMLGMDFEPGDEIIVSPIADYGTVAGSLFQNYIPVFADTEPGTALISARTIEPCITKRTRAIICVHKLGLPCEMDPIMALARKHNLLVIEDVCQAILSTDKGRLAGTMGDVACFSFDAEKTCGGDIGGAMLTNNEEIYQRVNNRAISRGAVFEPGFGRAHDYQGFATRMPQCTAATCMANLEILPRQVENRRKMAALLDQSIGDLPGIITYTVPKGRTHTYWMYGFSIDPSRLTCGPDAFADQMVQAGMAGVGLGRYYLMPVALRFLAENCTKGVYPFCTPPASRLPDYSADRCPNARNFLDNWIRWFWTEKYNADHVHFMASVIKKVVEKNLKS